VKTISPRNIRNFKDRFPALRDFGMLDDVYAIAVLGADRLGCRPCDVRQVDVLSDGSITVQRI
jgi:negative regulator of sigma E activity